jgi:hypothetical protein
MEPTIGTSPETKLARQRFSLCALTLALIVLSLAVLNWGLQYKMSLYQNSQISTHAPAKLWTGKTGAHKPLVEIEQPASNVVPFPQAALTILLLFPRLKLSYWLPPATPWKLRASAALHSFVFRPPPSQI